jgi:hypothetical protein
VWKIILEEDDDNVVVELDNEHDNHDEHNPGAGNVTTADRACRDCSARDTSASDGTAADGGSTGSDGRPSRRFLLAGRCAGPDDDGRVHGLHDNTERLARPLAIRMTQPSRER